MNQARQPQSLRLSISARGHKCIVLIAASAFGFSLMGCGSDYAAKRQAHERARAKAAYEAAHPTPLLKAAHSGRTQEVLALIGVGSHVDERPVNGLTVLQEAASHGYTRLVAALINSGASLNIKDAQNSHTALHIATINGHSPVVSVLIRAGANVNTRNKFGYTPLHDAASRGHYEVAAALIRGGADVNARDTVDDRMPLHFAKDRAMQVVLIEGGASRDAQDTTGRTAKDFQEHEQARAAEALAKAQAEARRQREELARYKAEADAEAQKQMRDFMTLQNVLNENVQRAIDRERTKDCVESRVVTDSSGQYVIESVCP